MIDNKNSNDKIDNIIKAFGKNTKSYADVLQQLLNKNVADGMFNINVLTAKKPRSIKSLPTAGIKYRGNMYLVKGDSTTADKLYICLKSSTGTYSWVQVSEG